MRKRITICGPKGIAQQVQSKIKAYIWNLIEDDEITYEIREIIAEDLIQVYLLKPKDWNLELLHTLAGDQIYQEDNFTVRYTILDHKTDSIAYRFDHADKVNIDLESSELRGGSWIEGLKEAFLNHKPDLVLNIQGQEYLAKNLFPLLNITKGHSLGVIMDHAANAINHQKIEQLFSNCNTVYIERFFKKSDQELAKAHYHSYTLASASIMKKIGVQKAIPIHFSRRYKTEDIQDLILEFEEIFED